MRWLTPLLLLVLVAGCGGGGKRAAPPMARCPARCRQPRPGPVTPAASPRRRLTVRGWRAWTARWHCGRRPGGARSGGSRRDRVRGSERPVRHPPARGVAGRARRHSCRTGAPGGCPRRRCGSAPSTSRSTSTAPRARLTVRRGGRVLRRFTVARRAPGERDADRPLRGHGQAPDARRRAVRLLRAWRSPATSSTCPPAGRAATAWRSTAPTRRGASARRPASGACGPPRPTSAG